MTQEEVEQAEQDADIGKMPAGDDDELLMALEVGDYLDCRIEAMQLPRGKMESPLLHGVTVKQAESGKLVVDVPMKMWASTVLARIFEDLSLFGRFVRIRRMNDHDFPRGRGRMYRVSDLNKVLALMAKDKHTGI